MPLRFIDTHCHFDFAPFVGDELLSLQRAAQAKVKRLIVPSVSAERFDGVLQLAQTFPAIYAALGLHPIYIHQHDAQSLATLSDLLAQQQHKVLAIGEIGLDLYIDEPQIEQQIMLLQAQLQLAKQFELPVILHSRRTHDLLASQLKKHSLTRTGVIHGFAGSLEQAQRFIRLGYFIGVGGVISYPRAQKTRQVMAVLPLKHLVLETDAPDMPLAGFQGQPNRPERIRQVFDAFCLLRPEQPELIAHQLYNNTCRLFDLTDDQ